MTEQSIPTFFKIIIDDFIAILFLNLDFHLKLILENLFRFALKVHPENSR
jgi:hypothetical protein